MSLLSITDRFINHLNSLERMMDYNEIIKDNYFEKTEIEFDILHLMDIVIYVKSAEYEKRDLETKEYLEKRKLLDEIITNKNVKFIYDE